MGFTDQIKKTALKTAFGYLEKNPEENAPKLMAWVDRLAGSGPDSFEPQRDAFRKVLADPNNNMYQLMMHVMHDVDTDVFSDEQIERFYNRREVEGVRSGELYGIERLYKASLDARPNQRYYIKCPDGELVIPPGVHYPICETEGEKVLPTSEDHVWKWTYDRYIKEKNANNIVFIQSDQTSLVTSNGEPAHWNVYNKLWLSDQQNKGVVPGNFIPGFENRQSSQELKSLNIPFVEA